MPTGSRTGRPSKGDRRVVFSRHPRAQADVIEELARARGLTLTEVMVALTAVGLNHLSEAQLPQNGRCYQRQRDVSGVTAARENSTFASGSP